MPMRTSSETKLLDAVDELVFSQGIEATPVDAVLARAGVSAATMYRGYRGKDALVAAALERRHEQWRTLWERAVDAAGDDGAERLLAVFDAMDEFARRPAGARWCAFLGTAAEYAAAPPEIAAAVDRDTAHLRETLGRLAADIACRDPEALAEQILVVVTGELAMRLRDNSRRTSAVGRRMAAVLIGAAVIEAAASPR